MAGRSICLAQFRLNVSLRDASKTSQLTSNSSSLESFSSISATTSASLALKSEIRWSRITDVSTARFGKHTSFSFSLYEPPFQFDDLHLFLC